MLLSKPEEFKRVPNSVTIVSMAKTTKIPDADIYIDVSRFMVDDFPFYMMGTDHFIKNTLKKLHQDFFIGLADTIEHIPLDSGLLVVLVCNAGERRSVASAEILADELAHYFPVNVLHKELNKWFKF